MAVSAIRASDLHDRRILGVQSSVRELLHCSVAQEAIK